MRNRLVLSAGIALLTVLGFSSANALSITLSNNTYEYVHYFHFHNSNLLYGASQHGEKKDIPAAISMPLIGTTEHVTVLSATHIFNCGDVAIQPDDIIVITANTEGCHIRKFL